MIIIIMGTNYTFRCNRCKYEVMTSGGHDCGMLAVTDTYICKSCKMIVDVTVGERGVTYSKEEALLKKGNSAYDLGFYCCPNCGSDADLVTWDIKKKPCPKCGEKMKKDENGDIILWD